LNLDPAIAGNKKASGEISAGGFFVFCNVTASGCRLPLQSW
jgi:hypothetical protein